MDSTKIISAPLTDEDRQLISKRIKTHYLFISIWLGLVILALWVSTSEPIDWLILLLIIAFASFGLFPILRVRRLIKALNRGEKSIVRGRVEKIDWRVGYSHLPAVFYVGGLQYSSMTLEAKAIKGGLIQDAIVEIELLEGVDMSLRINRR